MTRALITGGAGCLGRALCQQLQEANVAVRIFDQRPPSDPVLGSEFVQGDITSAEAVGGAVQGVDWIFNLVALQPVSRAENHFHRVNVGGTRNVLESARRHRAKHVVHLSSSIVYGIPEGPPFREDSPLRPVGRYGQSKVEAERLCEQARKDLPVAVVRPRVIMGPGRMGLLAILFDWVRGGKRVYLIGSGRNRFQMVAASDLARACIRAAEVGASDTFNVASDDVPTVREELLHLVAHAGTGSTVMATPAVLARTALRLLDRAGLAPLTAEHYLFADKDFLLDTRKAKQVLGWSPATRDTVALCQAYDYYVENADRLPRDFAPDRPPLGLLALLRRFS